MDTELPNDPAAEIRNMSAELWNSAAAVLDADRSTDHAVPYQRLGSHQRSWDTAFVAIGLAYVDPGRAWRDLRDLFEAQWADGRVPHLVRGPESDRGSEDGRDGTGLVQPPLQALAAWEVYRRSAAHGVAGARQARAELAWLYPRLVAQQRYLLGARDVGGTGLASIVHPWESGMDDSPAWDAALAGVPTDGDGGRHLGLVRSYRDCGYRDTDLVRRHPFVVECPAFNAILASAELALARIAEVVGADAAPHRDRGRRITDAIVATLWDPQTHTFRARDVRSGMLTPARCVGGLVPLMLPDLPAEQLDGIVAEARSVRFGLPGLTGLPLPGHDRTARDFDPLRTWRGPVWITMNWLLRRGLLMHGLHGEAENLRGAMVQLMHSSGHFGCYHPDTGAGIGAPGFSGTAAVALDLLADRSVPAYAHAA